MKKKFIAAIMAVMVMGSSLTVYAAPETMPDGEIFDAEYYAALYPDVAAALGTDADALYSHYVNFGKAEGRLAYAAEVQPQVQSVIANSSAVEVTQKFLDDANKTHKYYTKIDAQTAAEADNMAKAIADAIMADPDITTDCERMSAAAQIVAQFCAMTPYGSDPGKYYRSPAGVFSGYAYTCAGSTRALGRILDYMGYTWVHANENQYSHQWCIVTMDGQTGYADGMGGFAGYGDMTNGMTLPNGMIIYYYE